MRRLNQLSWIEFGPSEHQQLLTLVLSVNTYRQIAGADLPLAIPEDFRRKVVKGVAIRSDTSSGFVPVTNFVGY